MNSGYVFHRKEIKSTLFQFLLYCIFEFRMYTFLFVNRVLVLNNVREIIQQDEVILHFYSLKQITFL